MKTKNNVQKAILRSAAVVVSFILISFTVSAQIFWKRLLENTGFSDIAIAMSGPADNGSNKGGPAAAETFYYYTNEVEPAIELEDWMTDESRFAITQFMNGDPTGEIQELGNGIMDKSFFQSEEEKEAALELDYLMRRKTDD